MSPTFASDINGTCPNPNINAVSALASAPVMFAAERVAHTASVRGSSALTMVCSNKGREMIAKKAIENPNLLTAAGCVFVAGWCAGRLTDGAIMKIFRDA
jgi:hypothetical protein